MGYALGAASRRELVGVHPDLIRVTERAIEITRCDFAVHDGIRTVEEQRRFVAQGFSKTMKSKHLEGRQASSCCGWRATSTAPATPGFGGRSGR